MRLPTYLCGLRVRVEKYHSPEGTAECKRCQRLGRTQRKCSYTPWRVTRAAVEKITLPALVVASGRKQRRLLQNERNGTAVQGTVSPPKSSLEQERLTCGWNHVSEMTAPSTLRPLRPVQTDRQAVYLRGQ
jgi:hypothetical protein